MSPNIQIALSVLLACLPAVAWAVYFFEPKNKNNAFLFKVFLGGTLTVFPILGLQLAYMKLVGAFPSLDFVKALKVSVENFYIITVITYVWVGISEEFIKFFIVRYADNRHPEIVSTINGALKFGLLSALGFAFSENIFYFYSIWKNMGANQLLAPFLFRSTFTVCAHLMFSGIFAYHYGTAKFTKDIIDFKKWQGIHLDVNAYQKFRSYHLFMGLFLAAGLHAIFNTALELSSQLQANVLIIAVIVLVGLMFAYLSSLLNTHAGNLKFKIASQHRSFMAEEDINVIMEYIGMRFSEGKYNEVIGICERLLHRDPDNNVAKIFEAKAKDKLHIHEG